MAVSRQHKPLSETEISLAVYRILMTILSDARACRFPDDEKQIVSDSVEYILRHLSEKLSVEGIAAQYGYSAGYFSRLFRRSTGFSPYQFILNSRIDHSRRLLATTALPVQEIADRSGFAGLANFSCAFRRATGVSPSDGLRCKYRGTPSASFSMGRCDSGISSSCGVFGADGHSDGLCQSGWKAGSGCGGAGCVQDSGGTKGCSFSKGSAFAAGWGGMGEFMTAG